MKAVTYERSGRTDTGAQAVWVEGLRHLRVLEQGETVAERDLTSDEVRRLGPLLEQAWRQPVPVGLAPEAEPPDGLAVSLGFEDEESPRVRLLADTLPARGAGAPYDELLEVLDGILSAELHAWGPRHAHAVLPHMLRDEE
ncbi:hypothetical protein P2318_33720 [Myxococcaceae bacterium GXIMD 01537]